MSRNGKDSHRESHKPGGKVIRGYGRGGITRQHSFSYIPDIHPSRIREAFFNSLSLQLTQLTISNLTDRITDTQLYELFRPFGPVKSAKVHRDHLGLSMGYADILFESRSDAIKALKHYNGLPLDGQDMNIFFTHQFKKRLSVSNPDISSSSSSSSAAAAAATTNQKKNKRRLSHCKHKRTLQSTDDELTSQLEECMKNQLIISE